MQTWLVSPPVAFLIMLAACFLLSRLLSGLAFRPKSHTKDEGTSYACGENDFDNTAQPDYSVFFPFAFFFTLAHVATLIMTTVPVETVQVFISALVYITGAVTGLYILLRR